MSKNRKSSPTRQDRTVLEAIQSRATAFTGTFVEDFEYRWEPGRGWVFSFKALHVSEGVEVREWEMTAGQAQWFFTGCADFGSYVMWLREMGEEGDLPDGEGAQQPVLPTWGGEPTTAEGTRERLRESVEALVGHLGEPDAAASAHDDLRLLERVSLLEGAARAVQMVLVARLTRKGAGAAQVAAAAGMSEPELADFRDAVAAQLGDLSDMARWAAGRHA